MQMIIDWSPHWFGTFPNGSQDAIMWVGVKKDGLIFRVETGSTPINLSKK